jgi:hypothetical protein
MLELDDLGRFAAAFLVPALFVLVLLYIWLTTRDDRRKNKGDEKTADSARTKGGRGSP